MQDYIFSQVLQVRGLALYGVPYLSQPPCSYRILRRPLLITFYMPLNVVRHHMVELLLVRIAL